MTDKLNEAYNNSPDVLRSRNQQLIEEKNKLLQENERLKENAIVAAQMNNNLAEQIKKLEGQVNDLIYSFDDSKKHLRELLKRTLNHQLSDFPTDLENEIKAALNL